MSNSENHHHSHNHNHDGPVSSIPSSSSDIIASPSSSMAMTFSSLSDYRTSILFSSWTTSTPIEFAIAWILVVLAVVAYHALRYYITIIEETIAESNERFQSAATDSEELEPFTNAGASNSKRHKSQEIGNIKHGAMRVVREKIKLRIIHSIVSGLNYGVSFLWIICLYEVIVTCVLAF